MIQSKIYPKSFLKKFLSNFPLSFLIGLFLFDQLINRFSSGNLVTQTIYPLMLFTFFAFQFDHFTKRVKLLLVSIFLFLYIYSYSTLSISYLIITFVSIITFFIFYNIRNKINNIDLSITLIILRIFIYFSFIIFIITYTGLSDIGLDFDNSLTNSFTARVRCSGNICLPVFRSLITNSNYFIAILLFTTALISKFKKDLISKTKISIFSFQINTLNFDKVLILIMALVSDSRIYFLGIFIILIYDFIEDWLLKNKFFKKNLLVILFSILSIFILNPFSSIFDLPIIKGILYIPKTLFERIPSLLDFSLPISILGNGFGVNWSESFSFSSEYLLQMIIIDFGLLGLFLILIFLLKFFSDNYDLIINQMMDFNNKFLSFVIGIIFLIMILKAASDIRNIPLAMIIGFFYPNSTSSKKLI